MKYIQGTNRNQLTLFPVSLDDSIDPDNEVRIIDLFVDSLNFSKLRFRVGLIGWLCLPKSRQAGMEVDAWSAENNFEKQKMSVFLE